LKLYTHGTGSKVALLLHGMASSSQSWRALVNDLLEHDYTVHTPDLPGHGDAARDRTFYSIEKWETMLLEQVERVDLLVGHSIGGLLALKTRCKLKAAKTVAIDPVLRFPTGPLRFISQQVFGIQEAGLPKRALTPDLSLWDRTSVRALMSPKYIPMPDHSVLLVRPRNSFVSPLVLLNRAPTMKVVTMKKVGHDLHHQDYPRFFKELKSFALI
jgi:pimeloyl-ACP methyl ester carboxylesterase